MSERVQERHRPDPRSVECPTCGAPEGSGCETRPCSGHSDGPGICLRAHRKTTPHAARIRAAESAEAERDRREQMTDWRNDSGVD